MESSRNQKTAGWILAALIVAMFCFSAAGKILKVPDMLPMLEHFGYISQTMFYIGFVEIACAILFAMPKQYLSFVGSILLTAYLGGATSTHVRIGEAFFIPIIMGILVWVSYGLRNAHILKKIFTKK